MPGRCRMAIFAAMKLMDQSATTIATDRATTMRPGACSAGASACTESGQPFCAHRELFDAVALRFVADAGSVGNADGALRRHGYFGFDDVFVPVASAGGNVAGQA